MNEKKRVDMSKEINEQLATFKNYPSSRTNLINNLIKQAEQKKQENTLSKKTDPKIISFPSAMRRQLASIDIVFSLIENIKKKRKITKKEKNCIARISNRIENIKTIHYGGEKLILSARGLRQYKKIITSLKKLVDSYNLEAFSNDFFNAVLLIVENARISSKKSKNMQLEKEWTYLNQSLMTLYQYSDPDLSNYEDMKKGQEMGNKMASIIE